MQAKSLGYKGEEPAAQFLRSKGYEIVQTNFTVRGGEVDLVALVHGVIVFVEVKTRTGVGFGDGDESMTRQKKMRLKRTIKRYLHQRADSNDADFRVDLVEIQLDALSNKLKNITHFEDIEL